MLPHLCLVVSTVWYETVSASVHFCVSPQQYAARKNTNDRIGIPTLRNTVWDFLSLEWASPYLSMYYFLYTLLTD